MSSSYETGRQDSRLQCRIFPNARNRNRQASFPPIACSSSRSFAFLDFFFLRFGLETALLDEVKGLSFLHSPFADDPSVKQWEFLRPVVQYNNNNYCAGPRWGVWIFSWPGLEENCRLLMALRISPELPEHSLSITVWSGAQVLLLLCLELWEI